ncbi:MAG: class I SAM-dependent methyltransferase [Pyrinomonadaceae bacterium]|nr:class I SAM-dependent methyltransferase [Pyrinomonadaceae bacterium]
MQSDSNEHIIDDLLKVKWDQSYNLKEANNLWGDEPVPFIAEAIALFKSEGGSKFIDIPCGDGRNLLNLAKSLPFVIGSDTSMLGLQIAKNRLLSYQTDNCLLMEGDVFNNKFLEAQFDGVLCWDLLGHLNNVNLAITELLRICKPGGQLIGSLFSIGDSTRGKEMDPIGNEEYIYSDKFYFKFYDEEGVINLLKNYNAELVSLKLVSWKESPHEGYREYPHEHESWVFVLKKT